MVKASLLSLLLLAGCASVQPVADPRAVWCEQNEPRRDSPSTRAQKEAHAIHNAKGVEWCGWKP